MNTTLHALCLTLLAVNLLLAGCAPSRRSSNSAPPYISEEAYCTPALGISNGITLSGNARYQYFKASNSTGGKLAQDTSVNPAQPFIKPIRRAEVRVRDTAGNIIQCGETDNSGAFSLTIARPSSASSLTVEVNSRGHGSLVSASVLDQPSTKKYYTVSASVSVNPSDTTVSVPSLEAPARVSGSSFTKIEGGAFHIFDLILDVNQFLRDNTANSDCGVLCPAFTVAPKVTVFWMKGFNPSSYLSETNPLSFFDGGGSIDSVGGLFILGGSGGDVDSSDTDHFDDSVIIHEYGHFLESHYWRTDSPGGIHNGNLIIDPRLAFSEGFADFLPSAVMGIPYYIDTIGSPDGSPANGVYINLETTPTVSVGKDRILTISPVGEGIYREVSVSRALWDFIDSASDNTYNSSTGSVSVPETSTIPFAFIWLALTNDSFGLKAPNQHFANMGQFNKSFYQGITSVYGSSSTNLTDMDTARLGEFQSKDNSQYAQLLTKSTCADRTITPVNDRQVSTSNLYVHDLFASSDLFRIDHPGGILNVELFYSGTTSDLDLYVFKEVHSLSDTNDIVAFSDNVHSSESPPGHEAVSANLSAGTYLIHVSVFTKNGAGSAATYRLTSGGQTLCNAP